jgi:hypothetical protein
MTAWLCTHRCELGLLIVRYDLLDAESGVVHIYSVAEGGHHLTRHQLFQTSVVVVFTVFVLSIVDAVASASVRLPGSVYTRAASSSNWVTPLRHGSYERQTVSQRPSHRVAGTAARHHQGAMQELVPFCLGR